MKSFDVEKKLLETLKNITGVVITKQQYEQDLTELGVDSIYAIDIANELEDYLGVVIDDRDIYKFRTIQAILNYFDARK